jgi:hypothetical protein
VFVKYTDAVRVSPNTAAPKRITECDSFSGLGTPAPVTGIRYALFMLVCSVMVPDNSGKKGKYQFSTPATNKREQRRTDQWQRRVNTRRVQ